jgi:hypothetical protein
VGSKKTFNTQNKHSEKAVNAKTTSNSETLAARHSSDPVGQKKFVCVCVCGGGGVTSEK